MREETLAMIPRFGSTAPISSTMTSLEKGYSLSLTTNGALIIFSRCRLTSAGIPRIIQHLPAWRLQPQTLVAWAMFAALEVSHNLLVAMSQYRDVLAANTAIERAGLCRNIYGPSQKKLTNITGSPSFLHLVGPFGPQSSAVLTHVALVATCVAGGTQLRNSTRGPLLYQLQPAQNCSKHVPIL